MLEFLAEWKEAPGVTDPVLAATWARLEIKATVLNKHRWLSELISARSNSLQRGVYGSLFPLAEWVVENWWFLLHEPCRVAEYYGGRELAVRNPKYRPWVQRHNFLAAREGGALPDLTLYRDGPLVVVYWAQDPQDQNPIIRPTRFIGEGMIRLRVEQVEQALQDLVAAVIHRLGEGHDEDTQRLGSNWKALCESRQNEADLCAWAASLGLDPYDPDALPDELIDLLQNDLPQLEIPLRQDFLEASSRDRLPTDLTWVKGARARLRPAPTVRPLSMFPPEESSGLTAHEWGYRLADAFRQRFSFPAEPMPDLSELLHRKCGWPVHPEIDGNEPANRALVALVGKATDGTPHLVGPPMPEERARRFRLARALYFLPSAQDETPPRLVTSAHTWDQRASRAFAAELLAPATALAKRLRQDETVEEISREFQVDTRAIIHQIDNHGLGDDYY